MAKYDVFISYSRKDMAVANRLCDALDKLGVSYWIDRNIHGSANFLSEITRYIRNCRVVVFIASPNSAQSEWTQKEILFALKHKKEIIPYRIGNFHFEDNDELDFVFTNVQWIESEAAVVLALKELGCTFGSTPAPTPAPKPVPTPKSPRNPINWRKWIKSSAIGTLVVAFMALFAYAMFAPDAIVEPTAAEDSVSIVNTVKTQPIQKEQQVAQTAEMTAPNQSAENSKDTEVKQPNKPKQQTTQTSTKESAPSKVTTESTVTTQQNISSVATSTTKPNALTSAPYKVGDYYSENGKEGVVFEVSADGKHGKIVSMTQSRKSQWSSDGAEQKRLIGADSMTDGAYNMAKVKSVANWQSKYPAFKWCADLGEGWYLPSLEELKKFTLDNAVHDAVNRTLTSKGGEKLFNRGAWYWSSTECNERYSGMFCAWLVYMSGGYAFDYYKNYGYSVRAVSAF